MLGMSSRIFISLMLLSSKVSQKRRDAQMASTKLGEDQNEEFTLEDVIEFLVTEGYVWDH